MLISTLIEGIHKKQMYQYTLVVLTMAQFAAGYGTAHAIFTCDLYAGHLRGMYVYGFPS